VADKQSASGRDLYCEWFDQRPLIGRGDAPDGRWDLRASYEPQTPGTKPLLSLSIELSNELGLRAGAGGCGSLAIANDERPILVSMSRMGPHTSFCYAGQVVTDADQVSVFLSDGSAVDAVLSQGDLPIKVWTVFTDGTTIPVRARAMAAGADLAEIAIPADWPEPNINTCWGPRDEAD
jgi:hypothetical protein